MGSADRRGGNPRSYINNSTVSIPDVKPGLTIDPAAKIAGALDYSSPQKFEIPDGAVAGKVTYTESKPDKNAARTLTPVEKVLNSGLDVIRTIVSAILENF